MDLDKSLLMCTVLYYATGIRCLIPTPHTDFDPTSMLEQLNQPENGSKFGTFEDFVLDLFARLNIG